MKMQGWNKVPVAALAVIVLPVALVSYAGRAQTTGANTAAPTAIIAPTRINLPTVPAEVLRMSEAGVSDSLIISYIQKSDIPYTLDAQQIVYLHDLGVSSAVLKVLVAHGGTAADSQTGEAAGGTTVAENVSATTAPPVSGVAADFYNSLAPYGTWVDVPAYGWCWQPTAVVINPAWQPYSNNGCWLWTDQGWYWNSYYSWGWSPFHYGRWCRYPGYGWLWCPGNSWGPAWVCWRNYPGYCGWAPLPPGAAFTTGVGWTYNGLAVGVNFGFNLGPQCFTFCDYDHFYRRHPFDHFRHGRDADRFFHDSRVDNDFALDAHQRFINRGIGRSRIEAATHTRIHEVAVHKWSHQVGSGRHFIMPDRLIHYGHARVIYRPDRDFSGLHNHFWAERHTPLVDHWSDHGAAPGFAIQHEAGNSARFQPGHWNGLQHSAPGVSLNRPHWNTFNRHWSRIKNSQVKPFRAAPDYPRNYSESRHFTPAWHSTPTWHPAPVWHSTPVQRSAPVWHPVPAWHSASVWHSPTIQHSPPVWHSAPIRHFTPAWHPASVLHSTPAWHPAPAWHSAPVHSWNGRTYTGGEAHFDGDSAHFGGGMAFHSGFHR